MSAAVSGLLLAAGAGRRLGTDKAALELGGATFGERALAALHGGCAEVVVVAAPGRWQPDPRVRLVLNTASGRGLSSSLRLGLSAVALEDGSSPAADAVVVTLVDTPLVIAEHVRRLVAQWRAGCRLGVATYAGRWRTPVLLGREHWTAVALTATGDRGARPYLEAHADAVTPVDCSDLGPWLDVDTTTDLSALRAHPAAPAMTSGRGG